MRSDAEVIRELMEEAQEEAVACQARADFCWATGADDRAEEHISACATQQARARALSKYLAMLEPTGALDPGLNDVLRDRPAGRPTLTLHSNPGAPRG